MVFLSLSLLGRVPKPDAFWRKRRTFRLTAHFYGRARNCYKVAISRMYRSLQFSKFGRDLKRSNMVELWQQRLEAGCQEHGASVPELREGLMRCNIALGQHILADLAIWEPRSFRAVVNVCQAKLAEDRPASLERVPDPPANVITRGML